MRPVLGPVRRRPGPGRRRPGPAGTGPAAAAWRPAGPGADRAPAGPGRAARRTRRPGSRHRPGRAGPARQPRRGGGPASPARSSAGTAARSATALSCCAMRRGTAPGSLRMPAMSSRCSRSPPPWSTCASSARRRISSAPRTTRRCGTSRPQAALSLLRARIHLAAGRLADAAADGQAALAIARALGAHGYAATAHSVLSVIELRRGDIAAAAQHLACRPAASPQFADIYARPETTVAEAQITEARDGPAAALGHLRQLCADLQARPGPLLGDPALAAWLARTALAAGDSELAARAARTAQALADAHPSFPALAAAAAHSQRPGPPRPGPPGRGRHAAPRSVGQGLGRRRPRRPARQARRPGSGDPLPEGSTRRIPPGRRRPRPGPHPAAAAPARHPPPPLEHALRQARHRVGQPDRYRASRRPPRRRGTEQQPGRRPHVHQHPHRRPPPPPGLPQAQHRLTRRTHPHRYRAGRRRLISSQLIPPRRPWPIRSQYLVALLFAHATPNSVDLMGPQRERQAFTPDPAPCANSLRLRHLRHGLARRRDREE